MHVKLPQKLFIHEVTLWHTQFTCCPALAPARLVLLQILALPPALGLLQFLVQTLALALLQVLALPPPLVLLQLLPQALALVLLQPIDTGTVTDSVTNSGTTLVGYVHDVSPVKRNKRNPLNYSTFTLQVGENSMCDALCYSTTKRAILTEKEAPRPVKIARY